MIVLTVVSISGLLWSFYELSHCAAENVTGSINGKVTLTCNYFTDEGTYPHCWGQGHCTLFSCKHKIVETYGHNVTWRRSDRYQLLGDITQGDVSLTITEVTKEDEGTYCCRVEIPGLFNDEIKVVTLMVKTDEEDSNLQTDAPVVTNSTQILSPNSEPPNWKTFILLASIVLAVKVLATVLYLYIYKKRNTSRRTKPRVMNLNVPMNQTAENIYIED
ncbi:T-cell immunoglobulin and mucin domain-containing protein 4-like [Engystomops pustulosus]|uniref:T-cell immunoglobulin and mucin domain-containing protein 4-like n=1 Tax=Engystomops pustulosus TaxID=76066 RepID=UPI003AFB0FEA